MTQYVELLAAIVGLLIAVVTLAGWIARRRKSFLEERARQRELLEKIAADVAQLKLAIESS
jgi:hypothetical protein